MTYESSHESAPREPAYQWPQALDFEVYMARKRESFTGRVWLFEEIQEWLTADAGSRALLVKADPGVGKSAFASEYVRRFRGQRLIAWHFCRHDRPDTLEPGTFVRSFAAQLSKTIPEHRQIIESSPELQKALEEADTNPPGALESAVLAPLAGVSKPAGTRLLLVDALDESLRGAAGSGLVELLGDAARHFPAWLRLLATSRPVPEVLAPLQAGFRPHEIVADAAANLDDLRQHVLAVVPRKGIRERLEAEGIAPESFAELLCDRSGGKFLFALHALREFADGTLTTAMLQEMPPEGMDAFYRTSLGERFGKRAEKHGAARALLGVMCAAREPLALAELAQILGVEEPLVLALRNPIAEFIRLSPDARSQLSFEHQSFKDWLTLKKNDGLPRAAQFAVDLTQAREHLHRWALKRVESGDAHTSPYLLRYLASHLQDDQEKKSVYVQLLLKCFEWSQAQLDLTGARGLLADVEHLGGHPEGYWLRALIRQAEPALRESAGQWPAQVLGRLGTGSWNIGLESLATAAQRWAHAHPDACTALLPQWRSLRWQAGLLRQLDGTGPVVVLPQGLIAYARGDDVCVCDPEGDDEPQVLEGHTAAVTVLAVLPDGRVISGGADHSVRVWSLTGAAPQVLEGHTASVTVLAVLPDGRVVSGSDDHSVRVWSLTGAASQVLEGHTDRITALTVLPDGRVVSGSDDHSVRVWSLNGAAPQVLAGHTAPIAAVAVLPDGRVVSGSEDSSVRVWSLSGAAAQVLEGDSPVITLAVLPDGRVVCGTWDRKVRVWSLASAVPQELDGHRFGVTALAVLPDGRVVSGGRDRRARVWSLTGAAPPVVLEGHTSEVGALAVLPGGRVVSGSDDGSVRVWSVTEATPQVFNGHTRQVSALAVLPDGRVVSGSLDKTVRVWSATGAPQVLEGHTSYVSALAVLPDGRVISGSWDKTVRVWSLNGSAPQVFKGHANRVTVLAVLPDGHVVSGSRDQSVRVWSLTGAAPQVLDGHRWKVTALAVLPDGRVVSGSDDHSVRVWSLTGAPPQVLEGHTDPVTALAVLPDGRVASGSKDHSVRLWSLTGAAPQLLEGHYGQVNALAALPDGRVVSGSDDSSVRVWSLTGGAPQVLIGHTQPVSALAVLPGGRVVSGSKDRTVRVWGLTGAAGMQRSFTADSAIVCLVTADGMIAAGCEDGIVHLLRLPP